MRCLAYIHELKLGSEWFEDIADGVKSFEIRSTVDRTYQKGDYLMLNEFDSGKFTGRRVLVVVTYLIDSHDWNGIKDDSCVMAIKPVAEGVNE